MNWTNFWPTLAPAVAALVEVVSGSIGPWLSAHPTITLLLDEGVDLITIQKLMGHESLETTQKYIHADVERARDLMPEF